MTVKERLIEYLKFKNIGQKDFAQQVGLSSGFVNAIRVSIQPKSLHKISMQFPDLNTGWLLTGEGTMVKNINSETGIISETKTDCLNCQTKDFIIEQLKSVIEAQNKTIGMLTNVNKE